MTENEKMKVVIVTGLSGAGKTKAADWFEDHGYYCIDNMPPAMIRNFLDLATLEDSGITKAAFVVDVRSDEFFDGLKETLAELKGRESIEFSILFVEASDATLIKRYNETRRTHPLNKGATTQEVVEQERQLLEPFRSEADYVIDTTRLKTADLFAEMDRLFEGIEVGKAGKHTFAMNIVSFGYKFGVPQEADMVFDMRFIPNPYYLPSLRKLTGNNKKVSQYVLKQEVTQTFLKKLDEMMQELVPHFIKEGKYHANIAIGCTGGQHRSVAVANELARIFGEEGYRVTLEHRKH